MRHDQKIQKKEKDSSLPSGRPIAMYCRKYSHGTLTNSTFFKPCFSENMQHDCVAFASDFMMTGNFEHDAKFQFHFVSLEPEADF